MCVCVCVCVCVRNGERGEKLLVLIITTIGTSLLAVSPQLPFFLLSSYTHSTTRNKKGKREKKRKIPWTRKLRQVSRDVKKSKERKSFLAVCSEERERERERERNVGFSNRTLKMLRFTFTSLELHTISSYPTFHLLYSSRKNNSRTRTPNRTKRILYTQSFT